MREDLHVTAAQEHDQSHRDRRDVLGRAMEAGATLQTAGNRHDMLAALAAIQKCGGAKPGDKTMLDALAPAVEALQAHKGRSLAVALASTAEAARGGVEATRDIAATGKARPLGTRSIGYPDPGAITTSLILEAMTKPSSGQSGHALAPFVEPTFGMKRQGGATE
jgi:dihydroxyacetone kinase